LIGQNLQINSSGKWQAEVFKKNNLQEQYSEYVSILHNSKTHCLSRSQTNRAKVSMDSTWHAAARLTYCQGVREIQPGSALIPPGMQLPQTYILSRSQRNTARVSIDSTWHAAATDLHPVKESKKYSR